MKKRTILVLLAVALVAVAVAVFYEFSRKAADDFETAVVTVTRPPEQEPVIVMASTPEPEEAQEAGAASEEAEIELTQLTGTITEVTDEYVMMETGEMGQVQANLFEDTLLEGVDALAVGQAAIVTYDGKVARSLPPQITALSISVNEIKGTVTAIEDGRITVERTEGGDEVVLTLPEGAPALAVGDEITAYTTGVSTLSLPPQMNAIAIVK